MYEAIEDILCGGRTHGENEVISPATVAEDVEHVHKKMDAVKAWSIDTQEWLNGHIDRVENEDRIEELTELREYVQSVETRLEEGDQRLREIAEERASEEAEAK